MLRNSKPKIEELTDELLVELQAMGFCKYYDSFRRELDYTNAKSFFKPYDCCGGTFQLAINIASPYTFCGNAINPYVKIDTPYDSWCGSSWNLADFTKEMEEFQVQLARDIKQLRKLGIIS